MIEILINAIHNYCKGLISNYSCDSRPCQCLIRITNERKCHADELLNEFNSKGLILFFSGIKKGIDTNNSFPNYKAKIEDINGKTIKYLWREYNNNRQNYLNYEPSSIQKKFIKSITLEGIVTKYDGDEILISPMFVFEAMKQFSVFDESIDKKETNKDRDLKPYSPTLALFCGIVNEVGLLVRGEDESVDNYTKRVCVKYGYTHRDRIRQLYNAKLISKYVEVIKKQILPSIDHKDKDAILEYLDSKKTPQQNLYA